MYKIVFTKQALKDLEKLKSANIFSKAKALVNSLLQICKLGRFLLRKRV